jgi:hypothetical protein
MEGRRGPEHHNQDRHDSNSTHMHIHWPKLSHGCGVKKDSDRNYHHDWYTCDRQKWSVPQAKRKKKKKKKGIDHDVEIYRANPLTTLHLDGKVSLPL